ncbi:hypothetical protein T310_9225 [Rasamsonia emersonii CBS 393.64]|uniref:Uncharacterized protein n=1 Tax=Rasamsonia emersonii (strain ATCC 16479 / CBS 393.64 / IMI 116815) TaxID=1408163 RepID=A0A0F4YG01_RASE3|nr:hypothetical protein T310_9225 [Rasamsonia emersonii CBS 393.64]KKA17147.1 hypothetical protein T310_9225 [Rasamsonia emersonii CBS 393.64]
MLLQHGHAGDDSRGPARRQRVQFDIGADQGRRELGVGGCAGTSTPDLRCYVVQFLAVLRMESRTVNITASHAGIAQVSIRVPARTLSATIGPLVARVSAAI